MKRRKFLSGLTTLGLAGVLPQGARGRDANAALTGLNVSVVYDLGGKLDKSFNQSGFGGVLEARRRLGARVTEFEVTTHGDQPDVLRRAARAATDVIVIALARVRPSPILPPLCRACDSLCWTPMSRHPMFPPSCSPITKPRSWRDCWQGR